MAHGIADAILAFVVELDAVCDLLCHIPYAVADHPRLVVKLLEKRRRSAVEAGGRGCLYYARRDSDENTQIGQHDREQTL